MPRKGRKLSEESTDYSDETNYQDPRQQYGHYPLRPTMYISGLGPETAYGHGHMSQNSHSAYNPYDNYAYNNGAIPMECNQIMYDSQSSLNKSNYGSDSTLYYNNYWNYTPSFVPQIATPTAGIRSAVPTPVMQTVSYVNNPIETVTVLTPTYTYFQEVGMAPSLMVGSYMVPVYIPIDYAQIQLPVSAQTTDENIDDEDKDILNENQSCEIQSNDQEIYENEVDKENKHATDEDYLVEEPDSDGDKKIQK